MNREQEPVSDTSDSDKDLARLTTVALVFALAVAVLGIALMLIGLRWRIDEATATPAQAAASSHTDARTTR
jgi:hypothetical protein